MTMRLREIGRGKAWRLPLAALLAVALLFAAAHWVATYRANQAAQAAAKSIELASVTFPLHASDDLRGMNVFLEVENPTSAAVEVTLSQAKARGNDQPLGGLNWMGEPTFTLPGHDTKRAQARQTVWQSVFSSWQADGVVNLAVEGTIKASADVLWVTAEHEQPFELSTDVHFF